MISNQFISWDEALSRLTESSQHKCTVRLLDTVFRTNGNLEWYYTTKNGVIAKKKKEKTKVDDVVSRFCRFASSNPNNTSGYVGVAALSDTGNVTYLNPEQLKSFLAQKDNSKGDSWLRVYLRPNGGIDQYFAASYSSNRKNLEYSVISASSKMESSNIASIANGTFACDQASVFVNDIRRCLEEVTGSTILSLKLEFVIDDNSHVWLSRLLHLQTGSNEDYKNSPDAVSHEASLHQLPGLPPRTTSSQGGRRGDSSHGDREKLIYREGGTLRSSLGPEDLPGLRAWVMTGMNGTSPTDWFVDLQQYRSSSTPSSDLQGLRMSRSEQRRVVSPLFAALLERIDSMLTGAIDVDDEEDFMDKWRAVYAQAVAANSSRPSAGEISVCGNCYAICAKLKSLVDVDFYASGKKVSHLSDEEEAVEIRPNSETKLYRTNKDKSNSSVGAANEVNRVRSSPALPLSQGGNEYSPAQGAPEHDQDNLSVSVLSMDSKTQQLQGGSKSKLSAVKKKQQAKKGGKGGSVTKYRPVYNDDDDDQSKPPNLDLLTKFAAERERQRQLRDENSEHYVMPHHAQVPPSTQLTSQKNGGPSSKKATKNKSQEVNSGLSADERRLMELERVAAASSVQGGTPYSFRSMESFSKNPSHNVLSGSEEEFMLRQAGLGDISQFSALESVNSVGTFGAGQVTKSTFDQEAVKKLKEHIASQDRKIQLLETSVDERDRELEKADKKYQDLNKKFVDFRAEAFDERDGLKLEYETKILELKESHAKHMASFARHDQTAHPRDGNESSPQRGQESGGTAALIQQLEILRAENKAIADKNNADRKSMQTEFSLKLLMSEKAHNESSQKYKGTISKLEDKVVRLNDEIESLTNKCDSLTERNHQLDAARIDAMNGQQKLRADLKSMQSSVANSYRLESSQSIGIGVDADTAIKLSEAKAEAKVRQLTNQVEFLKSQLAAELASVEEMRAVCDSAKEKAEFMKSDFRERMAEAERQRIADVEAAEVRTEQRYEIRMNELSSLQAKFASIQSQMQEAFQDSEAAKQREEMAKNSSAKAQAQVQMMRTEIEQLRRQVNELREKTDVTTGTDTEVNKHSQESMLRRLDNERQYLKSQLSSEITLKNELQQTLSHCQKQLADIQRQWTDDVDAIRESKRLAEAESVQIEQRMSQKITLLQSENERNKSQLEDMKDGFVKMREQLRSEQMSVENARAVNTRLTEELEDAKDEIKAMRVEDEKTAQMFREQLAAVTLSMKELEQTKNTTITGLREELSRQFMENSEVQKQSIILKRKIQDEKFGLSRKVEAVRVYAGIVRWHTNNISRYFRRWVKNAALVTAASQFRSKVKQLLKRKEEEYEKDKEYASHKAKTDSDNEWKDKMDAREKEHRQELDATVEHYEALREEEAKKAEERLQQQLDDKDVEWEEKTEVLKKEHSDELEELGVQHERNMNDLRAKFREEMSRQIGMLQEQAKNERQNAIEERTRELSEQHEQTLTDLEDSHFDKIRTIEQRHAAEMSARESNYEKERSQLVKKLNSEYAAKEAELLKEFAMELSATETKKDQEKKQAIDDCLAEAERVLSETRSDAHIATEERLRLMRQLWEEELEEKMAAKDASFETLVATRIEEANFAAADLKQKAVKLETSKWQQILKEAEKRYALEVQQARAKGYSDCEQKLKSEMQIAADDNERKIIISKDENRAEMSKLKQQQTEAMEQMMNMHELEIKSREAEAEARARKVIEAGMAEHIAATVAEAKQEVEDIWKEKLAKEEARLERLKADMSRLTYSQAESKRELQTQIDTLEIRLQQKEASCNDIIMKLQQDREREKQKLLDHQEKLKRTMTQDFEESKDEALFAAKHQWEEETKHRIEVAKDQVKTQLDLQMSELQEENDKLISSLETAMDELRREKVALSDELESTTTKLENCEDSLYDSQQAFAKLQKFSSISVWKSTAKLMQLRSYFEKEMETMQKDAQADLAQVQQESKERLEDLIMLVFRLSKLIVDTEMMRSRLNSTLTTYKTDVLVEKRTSIKLLEKELTRLGEEKALLEEQRDNIEDEVQELEDQVRDMEEQIREHNRSSSVMSNGRINVAHARKKKRYDTELERMLDLIEQKRMQMGDMDDRIERIVTQKDEKEADLVEMEKGLVVVLIEQQRLVLSQVEEAKSIEEKGKMLVKMSVIPWPPPADPDHNDVASVLSKKQKAM